ncbi:hypothetical protein C8F04DRAFT_1403886 [Mycena alexandri]|uniref:Uncharacterized protein n=1 Tax=Mycena alexandri TaxID=1745969 RepID=A0AAD6S2L0_9AGAR|nr:hypothetical protein C8F04DRAFT_1403886 [Mycena alexandri]
MQFSQNMVPPGEYYSNADPQDTQDHFNPDTQFSFNPGSRLGLPVWPIEAPQYYWYAGDFPDGTSATQATTTFLQNLLDESQSLIDSYDIPSSPSQVLGTFSNAQFSSPPTGMAFDLSVVEVTPNHLYLHSPRARHPVGSTSSANSSINLVPAFNSPDSAVGIDPFAGSSHIQFPAFTQNPSLTVPPTIMGPVLPPRGSIADIRRRQTPAPGAALDSVNAAIYVGLPFYENTARRNFFVTNVPVAASPSVADLIRALRGTPDAVAGVLNDICASLDVVEFRMAWSTDMIEVHDEAYSAAASGYREVPGALRDHLHSSQVVVGQATPNHTSRSTFERREVAAGTPLFVLYIFPLHVRNALPRAIEHTNSRTRPSTPAVAAPSRTNTPAPPASIFRTGLSNMLKKSTALDQHFLLDGFRLAALITPKFGAAYLQIRQAIIIENVYFQGVHLIPHLVSADVAAWAGLRPNTYSNNLTFAEKARATLLLLRARKRRFLHSPHQDGRSQDQREKDRKLDAFLTVCFAQDVLPADWDRAHGSFENLTIGGATVRDVSGKLEDYKHFNGDYYKKGRFTICVESEDED